MKPQFVVGMIGMLLLVFGAPALDQRSPRFSRPLAPAESFFANIKKELIYRTDFQNRKEAKQTIFVFLRIHSAFLSAVLCGPLRSSAPLRLCGSA